MFRKNIIVFLLMLVAYSCENQIDVINEVGSSPVIYSILNLQDSIYSVSLTKTFIGENNIYQLANDPDNVFYDSANITLSGFIGDDILWSTKFHKSSVIKDRGIFPNESGYLYQSNSVITEYDEYGFFADYFSQIEGFTLVVNIPSENRTITATVPVKHPFYITYPRYGSRISLYDPEDVEVIIEGGQGDQYLQLNVEIRYLEKLKGFDELQQNKFQFIVRKNIPIVSGKIKSQIPASLFFHKLAANMQVIHDLEYRKFIDFDLILYAADEVFYNYFKTYVHSTDLPGPAWSNINNCIGFLSLLFTNRKEGFSFDQITLDSLAMSPITRKLKFVKW